MTWLGGCSSVVKPPQGHGVVDSPLTNNPDRVACLRATHLPVQVVGPTAVLIGSPPGAARVTFEPTAGAAQALQMSGVPSAQGAEIIGAALLYPGQAPDGELSQIENCLDQGVREPITGQ
ncbi:MAG TPA: hypothetical protein VE983_08035 [Solirubrobacteraceae bacterium]|nr:hypothetical protein [Solirubrobacteraceae bacterium]